MYVIIVYYVHYELSKLFSIYLIPLAVHVSCAFVVSTENNLSASTVAQNVYVLGIYMSYMY